MGLSTHVLDTSAGVPAAGVPVALLVRAAGSGPAAGADGWTPVVTASTDDDGRAVLLHHDVAPGTYQLRFDTSGASAFFPEVSLVFTVGADGAAVPRLHVPLLLSPFGYTTYRGS